MTNPLDSELKKADTPFEDVSSVATLGSPDNSIILQFKELKRQRNIHLIDEPDFDAAVLALIHTQTLKARLKGRQTEASHTTTYMSVNDFSRSVVLGHTKRRLVKIEAELSAIKEKKE